MVSAPELSVCPPISTLILPLVVSKLNNRSNSAVDSGLISYLFTSYKILYRGTVWPAFIFLSGTSIKYGSDEGLFLTEKFSEKNK